MRAFGSERGEATVAVIGGVAFAGVVAAFVVVLAVISVLVGAGTCSTELGPVDVGPVTAQARADIPTKKTTPTTVTLNTLVSLSNKLDIDWHFVASVAAQECDFGRCAGVSEVNGSGCIGPMQLGVGGACGDFFGSYKLDGDGDGKISPTDPEDAVATAINGLKKGKGAPGRGGSYAAYRNAACGYYGACADGLVDYANEVMSRAVAYGFRGPGAPNGNSTDQQAAADAAPANSAPARTLLNLGDSLGEGIQAPLVSALSSLWKIDSDTRCCTRKTAEGLARLEARSDADIPSVLVVSLGTNDDPRSTRRFRRQVKRVLEIAGPSRCVIWTSIRRPPVDGVSYKAFNDILGTERETSPNLTVLDTSHDPGIGADGVHYTVAGYKARAVKIAAAAEACFTALSPGSVPGATSEDCGDAGGAISASGAAELQKSVRLTSPRRFKTLPADVVAPGYGSQQVDERIWPDAVYVLRTYHLRVTAGREAGHKTHGDGTAMDMVPALGNTQPVWDDSAGKLAADLGWTPGACGRNGRKPICKFVPAIIGIFYDGYPGHGSPRTCQGQCPAHIHVSWESDTFGAYPRVLGPPPNWVEVFPVPGQLPPMNELGLGGVSTKPNGHSK
jgi:lysophospholipase L1-like esterase